ncbi:MAG TPA: LytTR family DNA-binding domain-containing protein [Melioribacteraceae bacterium]|nr:LytTR family DNA-binding domain-containing protein [Melioribacteraceae bacterium]
MIPLKAIIVDDEPLAREDLNALLQNYDEIEVIYQASTVNEAEEYLKNNKCNLVFLDIQMPGKTGLELVKSIPESTKIIFVTAYDEHAIKAFELDAIDYLLKPVNKKRFEITLQRILERAKPTIKHFDKIDYDDTLFLMINNSHKFIKISDIYKINSAGNYSELYCTKNIKGLVLKNLKEWEERLPANKFIRIHKNTIINLNYILKIEDWFNSTFRIYLNCEDEPHIMSRRYAYKLKETMR